MVIAGITIKNNTNSLNVQNSDKAYSSEEGLINSYEDAEVETVTDSNGNEIDTVEVNAYFIDESGNKKRGTYQKFTPGTGPDHENEYVTLHVDLGVSKDNVTITNGEIKLANGLNAYVVPTTSEKGIIKEVVSDSDIKLNDIVAGNSADITFTLRESVYHDNGSGYKDNYTNDNSVIISGTYVDEDGTQRSFDKTIDWKLDWNADVEILDVAITDRLGNNGELILLPDKRIAASLEVKSSNIGNGAIMSTGEFKMTGLKVNDIAPSSVTVSDVRVPYNYFEIEDANYDATTDTLTWKSIREKAGEGRASTHENFSYITIIWPSTLYTTYLENQTNEVSTTLNLDCKNMSYVNPNIIYNDQKSLLTGDDPELGCRYTELKSTQHNLKFDNIVGELYRYNYEIINQNKLNSEYIFYGVNTDAGYMETCEIDFMIGDGVIDGAKIDWDNETPKDHSFVDNDENYYSHEDYKSYTGITIFEDAIDRIGDNGWIKVYDAETKSLIGTYNEAGGYQFDNEHKKIYIETSKIMTLGKFSVNPVIKIDNEELKSTLDSTYGHDNAKNKFDSFNYIADSSQASIRLKGESDYSSTYPDDTKVDYINGKLMLSAKEQVTSDKYETTKIDYDAKISVCEYKAGEDPQSNITYLKDPEFLVEFPRTVRSKNTTYVKDSLKLKYKGEEIEGAEISKRYTKNGLDYFIISVKGEFTDTIQIFASFNIVPKTQLIKSESATETDFVIRTFAHTKYDDENVIGNIDGPWWCRSDLPDTYDWNSNGDTSAGDYFYANTTIIYTDPVGLGIKTTLNMSGTDEEIVSPNLLELDRATDNGKSVVVNNYIYNYTQDSISNVKFVGRIPYKGNNYIKSGDNLGSTFDTVMTSGIAIPTELKNKVKVYYSNEQVNIGNYDSVEEVLNDSEYNWTSTYSNTAKSFLIDFGDTDIDVAQSYDFTYEVKLPDTLEYGTASYTSNAVLYNYTAEEGQKVFALPVESPRVGLSVISPVEFNINFIKVDSEDNTKQLTGAIYELSRPDGGQIYNEGEWVDSIELGSETDFLFQVKGLYPEIEYKLEEKKAPTGYKKQDVKFKIKAGADGKWNVEVTEGSLSSPYLISDNSGVISYRIDVPDDPDETKYKVQYWYQKEVGSAEYEQRADRKEDERTG